MSFKLILGSILGLVGVIVLVLGMMLFTGDDEVAVAEVGTDAMADRSAPSANNNPMDPVVVAEAARRGALHRRQSEEQEAAQGTDIGYVAPPVVTEIRSASGDDELTQKLFGDNFVVTPPAQRSEPEPEPEPVVVVVEPEPEPEPKIIPTVAEPEPEPGLSANWVEHYRGRQVRTELGHRFGVKPLEQALDGPLDQADGSTTQVSNPVEGN